MPSTADHIRSLISDGDLDGALAQALLFAEGKDPQLHNECTLFEGRLRSSQRDFGLGIMKMEDFSLVRNTISKVMMDVVIPAIGRLENQAPHIPTLQPTTITFGGEGTSHLPPNIHTDNTHLEKARTVVNELFTLLGRYDQGTAARMAQPLLHPTLLKNGEMKAAFRQNNFNVGHHNFRAYRQPIEITQFKSTQRKSIGSFGSRDEGEEFVCTLAKHQEQGGMPGMVRLFFSKNDEVPRITVISL